DLEAALGLDPVQSQADVDPGLRRRLDRGEGPLRADERDVGLAGLELDVPEREDLPDDPVVDRDEAGTVAILAIDELVGILLEIVLIVEGLEYQHQRRDTGNVLARVH